MLFVGDDWAEDHHDVYLMNDTGSRLASRRLPEGLAGIAAVARADRRACRGPRPGRDRHRNRPRTVGGCRDRGRLSGVRDQPAGRGPIPRPPPRVGGQVRSVRRQAAGRSGAHRPAQSSPDRRRQRPGRGDQGAGPGTPESDLGAHPPHQRAARRRCGSTTRRRWRRSRIWPTATPWRFWVAPRPRRRPRI